MANDSSTGGYLLPQGTPYPTPLEDVALDSFLQSVIAGVTGLPGNMVRPRWQPNPPTQPDISTDWIAMGIQDRVADTFAVVGHETPRLDEVGRVLDDTNSNTSGTVDEPDNDILFRNERLEVLCSVYGPNAGRTASNIREGLQIAQNREQLRLKFMAFVETGDTLPAPVLVNTQWYNRLDMTVIFRRLVITTYSILNIRSAEGVIETDISPLTRPFKVNPPPGV